VELGLGKHCRFSREFPIDVIQFAASRPIALKLEDDDFGIRPFQRNPVQHGVAGLFDIINAARVRIALGFVSVVGEKGAEMISPAIPRAPFG
jgi:hypothetical protein